MNKQTRKLQIVGKSENKKMLLASEKIAKRLLLREEKKEAKKLRELEIRDVEIMDDPFEEIEEGKSSEEEEDEAEAEKWLKIQEDMRCLGKRNVMKLNHKNYFLTYSQCNLDKKVIQAKVREKASVGGKNKKYEIIEIITGEELHKNGNTHFHILIKYACARQLTNMRAFDIKVDGVIYHPNIKSVNSNEIQNVMKYISKEDKDLENVLKKATELSKIFACEHLHEAQCLNINKSPNDIKVLWESRPDRNTKRSTPDHRDWYDHVYKIMNEKPNKATSRHVHWFHDSKGNTGKSVLAVHLFATDQAHYISSAGKDGDIANNITNATWDKKTIIMDLPRSICDYTNTSIYKAIEQLKNGVITNTKYKASTICLEDTVKVIIFANWWPVFKELSLDRWKLYDIVTDEETKVVSANIININDALRMKEEADEEHLFQKELAERIKERKDATRRARIEKELDELEETGELETKSRPETF